MKIIQTRLQDSQKYITDKLLIYSNKLHNQYIYMIFNNIEYINASVKHSPTTFI